MGPHQGTDSGSPSSKSDTCTPPSLPRPPPTLPVLTAGDHFFYLFVKLSDFFKVSFSF